MASITSSPGLADIQKIRMDFPILLQKVYGRPLVYLDNAATSQKPKQVIDALVNFYCGYNANIHRGVHFLSQKASQAYDEVRKKVSDFIGAASEQEIIFTRGTTESINLVAAAWGRKNISEGDEILISAMEHHSNIVPWQMLCEEKKAKLKVLPMNDQGELVMDELPALLSPKTKLVSVVHTSNSLGTINPVKEIIKQAHRAGAVVFIDGAQAVAHREVNMTDLDCDFFAFSGHKMLGPTGVGCLYGKQHLLENIPPYQGGGEMIHSVSFEKTTFNELPFKFEAGTPNIADVIALGAAIDYFISLDREKLCRHEAALTHRASEQLMKINGVKLIGTAKEKASVVSFVIDGVNALDAGMFLDTLGIAVRTGHHCTEPVMHRLGIAGTIRASFLFYNTMEEADALTEGVTQAIRFLKRN